MAASNDSDDDLFFDTHDNESTFVDLWAVEPYREAIAVPAVFGFIFVIGLIGNGTLIFTVAVNKAMRNVPNTLIVSLSLGDVMLILVSVPLTSTLYTFTSWPYGAVACKLNHFLQTWSLGVSVFTLTTLSLDRYLVIMDPLAKHKGKTRPKTLATVAVWVLSFLLALPDAVLSSEVKRTHYPPSKIRVCSTLPDQYHTPDQLVPKIYYLIRFIVFFAVPVVMIAVFYLKIARMLVRSGEEIAFAGNGNQQRLLAARKKVARIVLGLAVIFILCWLPRHVYLLWFFFDESHYNAFWHYFKILGFCLTYINSCVNPFALYFLSSQFRKYYDRYLFCCFRKVAYTRMDPSSTGFVQPLPRRLVPACLSPASPHHRVKGEGQNGYRGRRHGRGFRATVKQPAGKIRGRMAEVGSEDVELELQHYAWRKSPSPILTPVEKQNPSSDSDHSGFQPNMVTRFVFQAPMHVEIHAGCTVEGWPWPRRSIKHTIRAHIRCKVAKRQESTVTIAGDCSETMVRLAGAEKKEGRRRLSSP